MKKRHFVCYFPPHPISYINNRNGIMEREDITIVDVIEAEDKEEVWREFYRRNKDFISFIEEGYFKIYCVKPND